MKTGYENKMRKPVENKREQRVFQADEICKLTKVRPEEISNLKRSKKKKK